jgi:hypothetical protein
VTKVKLLPTSNRRYVLGKPQNSHREKPLEDTQRPASKESKNTTTKQNHQLSEKDSEKGTKE